MDHLESHSGSQRRLLIGAALSALVVLTSIAVGSILGDLPEALWFLLVPIGLFGAGIACATCLALAFARRAGLSGLQGS